MARLDRGGTVIRPRSLVDRALDEYVHRMGTRGVEPDGVRVGTLAALVGVDTRKMSAKLQEYRVRQSKTKTRYVIGCQGYGNPETSPNPPRWKILAKPTSDPQVVRKARQDHAVYLANDNLRKTVGDYTCEVFPALQGAARDHVIEIATHGLLQHLEVDVQTAVRLIENSVGTSAA